MFNYVIIGGSSGIGLSLALKLKSAGHNVWVLSRKTNDTLEQSSIAHISWDATSESFSLGSLPEVIHGLAYMPGSINLKPFHGLKLEDFQRDMELNVYGAIKAVQAALPNLKKANGASVVLLSTVAVKTGMPYHASIAAAKGAIEGLTRSLAAEYAPAQIRFNALAPSLTDTPLANRLLSSPEKVEGANKRHPLGRVGQPNDIAAMAAFLLSTESSWITGQVIGIDGGMGSLNRG